MLRLKKTPLPTAPTAHKARTRPNACRPPTGCCLQVLSCEQGAPACP